MNTLFMFRGKVRKGKNRGKLLGFPTVNIALYKTIPEGVYASKIKIDNQDFIAATFIGNAKTFNETEYKAEGYILDFNQDIYGKWITIKLFQKLRGNKKFKTEEELINQMKQDVLITRKLFS